jgi:hypothetical protein
MRVLLTIQPATGHLHPMVPLVRALLRAGHEVGVACAPAFAPAVEAVGLRPLPAGLDWLEAEAERAFPQLRTMSLEAQGAWFVTDIFAGVTAERMAADVVALAGALRPGESVADEVRLTESDVFFAGLLGGPLRRRVSLTTPFPEAGSAAVRLATRVLVPVAGRWDEPGLTLNGGTELDLTQDVDRATGWPRAAEGVLKVAGSLLEDDPAERTTADLELRLILRQR